MAYHLEKEAYDFYMQKVADSEENWDLHEFEIGRQKMEDGTNENILKSNKGQNNGNKNR